MNRTKPAASVIVRRVFVAAFITATITAVGVLPAPAADSTYLSNVPAGTYVATFAKGTIAAGSRVNIYHRVTGSLTWDRAAEYLIPSVVPGSLTALVRISSPADLLKVYSTLGTAGAMTLTPSSAGAGVLLTRGPSVVNASNQALRFRGMNLNNFNESAIGTPELDGSRVGWLRSKGLNVGRLLLSQVYTMPTSYYYNPNYLVAVKRFADLLISQGITPMLSLQYSTMGDPYWAPGSYGYSAQIMPDDGAVDFWWRVATFFKDRPQVMLELFNEPKLSQWDPRHYDVWRNGGWVAAAGRSWHAPGMQKLYETVRGTGSMNLVAVNGLEWGGNLKIVEKYPISGTNVMYAAHAYSRVQKPTSYPAHLDYEVWPYWAQSGSWRYAGFLNEFGTHQKDGLLQDDGSTYLKSIINWAEGRGLSWAGYGWYPRRSTYDYGLLNHWGRDSEPSQTTMAKAISSRWWG